MCSHYLIDPVACTPASAWEKGQVENQVGLVRERFFTPRLGFKTYDEMNAWLLDKCVAHAKVHRHPELTEQTIWEVFEAERSKLVPYAGRFDGFHAVPASVSKTCLVRFDNNKYSVAASAVGRPVEVLSKSYDVDSPPVARHIERVQSGFRELSATTPIRSPKSVHEAGSYLTNHPNRFTGSKRANLAKPT
jgi:hypothetical protein